MLRLRLPGPASPAQPAGRDYAAGNPATLSDPSGLCARPDLGCPQNNGHINNVSNNNGGGPAGCPSYGYGCPGYAPPLPPGTSVTYQRTGPRSGLVTITWQSRMCVGTKFPGVTQCWPPSNDEQFNVGTMCGGGARTAAGMCLPASGFMTPDQGNAVFAQIMLTVGSAGAGALLDAPAAEAASGAEGVTVGGGAGPVAQGATGVNRTAAEIQAAGGRILGREITVEAGGIRTRPDLFVELPNGQQAFIEVKTGPSAGLTANQRGAFPLIRLQGFGPYGQNAAGTGVMPGVPYGPIPVWVVPQPWP